MNEHTERQHASRPEAGQAFLFGFALRKDQAMDGEACEESVNRHLKAGSLLTEAVLSCTCTSH